MKCHYCKSNDIKTDYERKRMVFYCPSCKTSVEMHGRKEECLERYEKMEGANG